MHYGKLIEKISSQIFIKFILLILKKNSNRELDIILDKAYAYALSLNSKSKRIKNNFLMLNNSDSVSNKKGVYG